MRKFAAVAAVVLGFAGSAQAQVVVGTGGAAMPGGGLPMYGSYSPYPGAITSPFKPMRLSTGGYYNPAFPSPGYSTATFLPAVPISPGTTIPQFHSYGTGASSVRYLRYGNGMFSAPAPRR